MMKDNPNIYQNTVDRETPVENAARTFVAVDSLVERVERLVNRLVGPQPTSQGAASPPAIDALFPALEYGADRAHQRLSDAHDALNRLDGIIGS